MNREPMSARTCVIGLDAASSRDKFGYAIGWVEPCGGKVEVESAGLLAEQGNALATEIAPALRRAARALVAIDAPLGWPDGLRRLLDGHSAGSPPPGTMEKNHCFRRVTDVAIKDSTGKNPLEVGADRIARAAFEALRVLGELRELTGLTIPLVWSPDFAGAGAIEVYPGATLAARDLSPGPYKLREQSPARLKLAGMLETHDLISRLPTAALTDADVLDATLCLVAASDFLRGACPQPPTERIEQIEREGWIWTGKRA